MNDNNIIKLNSEGKDETFRMLRSFDYKGSQYVALSLIDDDESIVIMELLEDENGDYLETINDDMKAKSLFTHFVSLWETED